MLKFLFGVLIGLITGLILPPGPREQLSRQLSGIVGNALAKIPEG